MGHFALAGHFGPHAWAVCHGECQLTYCSKGYLFSLVLLSGLPQSVATSYFGGFFFLTFGHVTTLWQLAFCYIIDVDMVT